MDARIEPPLDDDMAWQSWRKRPLIVRACRTYVERQIHTLEGVMTAKDGDWIIEGIAGELYPCDAEIFAATFEAVDAQPTPVCWAVPRGSVIVLRGVGLDQEELTSMADQIVAAVGHNEFVIVDLPLGADLEIIEIDEFIEALEGAPSDG